MSVNTDKKTITLGDGDIIFGWVDYHGIHPITTALRVSCLSEAVGAGVEFSDNAEKTFVISDSGDYMYWKEVLSEVSAIEESNGGEVELSCGWKLIIPKGYNEKSVDLLKSALYYVVRPLTYTLAC